MMDGSSSAAVVPADVLARIAAAAPAHDRDGSFPHDGLAALHAAGVLALTVPAELGGGGAGLRTAAQVVADVGAACASTGLVLAMQFVHQNRLAASAGFSPQLRDRVARDAVEADGLVNALRVEPALGTPARGGLPDTVARRRETGWRISGHKIYCTGAPGLRWMLVWARTDEEAPRTGAFLVPADAPGISIRESWDHLGLRASGSHDVLFDEVEIPHGHAGELRPNEAWRGHDPLVQVWSTVLIGALYTAVARAGRDWVAGFLRDRRPASLGAPLATLPRMQEAVGAIEEKLVVNETLLASAIAAAETGFPPPAPVLNLFKTSIAENAVRAVEQAAALAGNHALSRVNPLERHWRDVLCARVHTPQADAVYLAAGRLALTA
jgi:alkylation response protein AidB-like acyl-CoA dehydrogenase